MDTAPLKSFATWARKELIREVTARASAVLAPGSPERVEHAGAVKALEKAVDAAGGGDNGRAAVADKAAYMWFNRIIALRFMDANGYTGIGVVSPQAGIEVGQPEVLAEAKRGVIDDEVVNASTRTAVTGLLDGTRAGVDPQGEAYALLLEAYCNHWHKAMPFMFEREGDFTELLIPANLLADDSVLNRAVKVLTEEVCQDVEVIGWLYQFYISDRKDEVFAGFKKNKKAGADEIPAATQLFTPHWIVRYLVENSLGRLWILNRPASGLVNQMDYYIAPVDEETDFLKIAKPEDLKVIDPACGSGHMLTYAFDLLYAIYEEEGYGPAEIPGLILTHNIHGTEIDPRAGALAAFALTMKARAKQRTLFGRRVEPNICVIEPISFSTEELGVLVTKDGDYYTEEAFWNQFADADTFGALIKPDRHLVPRLARHLAELDHEGDLLRADALAWAHRVVDQAEYLARTYAVVVANPPYMGSKQMNALLSQFMKDEYPDTKQDLYGAFVARGIDLAHDAGLLAIVVGDTWMSIKSFEALRLRLLDGHAFNSFVHMRDVSNHPDIFGANAAFVVSMRGNRNRRAPFVRLTPLGQERKERGLLVALAERTQDTGFHLASGADFAAIPGTPIVYWLSEKMRAAFRESPALARRSRSAKGLVTADNANFVRFWWEVAQDKTGIDIASRKEAQASRRRWFPYAKGGEFRRWAGNLDSVVDWQDDGRRLQTKMTADGSRVRATNFNLDRIFRAGLAWTVVTSGEQSFRKVPRGSLFDAAAGMCQSDTDEIHLAVLNSHVVSMILSAINPTLNLHPGYLGAVPVPNGADQLPTDTVTRLVETSESDWDEAETAWGFRANPLVGLCDQG